MSQRDGPLGWTRCEPCDTSKATLTPCASLVHLCRTRRVGSPRAFKALSNGVSTGVNPRVPQGGQRLRIPLPGENRADDPRRAADRGTSAAPHATLLQDCR